MACYQHLCTLCHPRGRRNARQQGQPSTRVGYSASWTTSSAQDATRAGANAYFCPFGPSQMYATARLRICCDRPIARGRKRTSLIPAQQARLAEVYRTVTHITDLHPGDYYYYTSCAPSWESQSHCFAAAASPFKPYVEPHFLTCSIRASACYAESDDMPYRIVPEEPADPAAASAMEVDTLHQMSCRKAAVLRQNLPM